MENLLELALDVHGGLAHWSQLETVVCRPSLKTPWDELHAAYFNRYALWTYLYGSVSLCIAQF